ncbi:MAG: polyhydroxyalkanoate synthesis regulator DNA-binding domain-containing protein [Nitrospirae bacterium]|nr:polyhydroxyalkanoate synthesis regulator DNA-binding domain-containing protein [Nitrospirota bacterium]
MPLAIPSGNRYILFMDAIVFKKYKNNRRLYDTSHNRYVNLDEIEGMVRRKKAVRVVDAQTGRDLTNSVLLQIILNRAKGNPASFLPTDFLSQLIQYQGKSVFDFYRNFTKVASGYLSRFHKGFGGTKKIVEEALDEIGRKAGPEAQARLERIALQEIRFLKSKIAGLETRLSKKGSRR